MSRFKDHSSGVRLLYILKAILEYPYRYTKKELAKMYNVSTDAIKSDLEDMRQAGFELDIDRKYRYALQPDRPYEQLKDLLIFSEEEQTVLMKALQTTHDGDKTHERLRRKIASIYDLGKMYGGHAHKPYLTKLNLLEKAKNDRQCAILKGYRSTNSGHTGDRRVEPFHLAPEDDILHAFDVDKGIIRHFRISRIQTVEVLAETWANEGKHRIDATDPFRISEANQVYVHLQIKVGGYNELVERFPLTRAYLHPSGDREDVYDFMCKVNHNYFGLKNFILGNYEQIIAILEPQSLIEYLREEITKINF